MTDHEIERTADKAKILICDDRPANLLALQTTLEELDQDIITAGSGREALKQLLDHEFAVVLLDVGMPDMDGFETAELIRGSRKTAHTPIIFVTAEPAHIQSAKGYALGAVDYIVTPVIPEILRTKVRVFVELFLMTREAKRAEVQRTTQQMIEALPNPIYFTGIDGRYRGVNEAWEQFFGKPRAAVIGKTAHELFEQNVADKLVEFNAELISGEAPRPYEGVLHGADGFAHDLMFHKATYAGHDHRTAGIIATIVDITDRKQADKREAMEHAVTRAIAEAASLGEAIPRIVQSVCETLGWDYGARWEWDSNAKVLRFAESWSGETPEMLEFTSTVVGSHSVIEPGEAGLVRRAFATAKPVWISDLAAESGFSRKDATSRAGLHAGFAFPLLRGNEVIGVMEFLHRDVRTPDARLVKIAESMGREIGQYLVRMQAEEAVKFIAMHDALTGLPNRVLFNERLASAVAQARRHERGLAVLFVDLDRFKLINDTLGHEAGDDLLRETARRLIENLRAGDAVARLGGDEFVVLLEEVAERHYVASVSQKLIAALAAPFVIKGREYHITASVGVSVYPEDGDDPPTLLKHADSAMYRAKEQGRNAFEFYSAHIGVSSLERLSLENGLRRAIENNELELYYQPQIETCSGRIVGMEALVRWQHREMGLLPPARFIRIAEETGLIVPLGEWVVREACRAHREWEKLKLAPARMAVNLSPRQFLHAGLVKDILRALTDTSCKGQYLELEITEGMVMHDPAGAVALIEELKEMGVRIAVDDFGTGYSSLAYLKRFPIDSLKVDRSFLADVPADSGNVAITQAIIAMARTLHLTVIAEGVETREQFNFLRARGCDEVQGNYFSPPLPFDQATTLLREGAAVVHTPPESALRSV